VPPGQLVRAAVLVPLVDRGEPYLVFAKRTDTVGTHRGQIAFPGGTVDPGDASFLEAALRECEEEIGLPRAAVVEGLRSFLPDPGLNPGRMNLFDLDGRTVIVDLAHNEAGLRALLEVCGGLRQAGGRILIVVGTAGDRPDELIRSLGELAARGADRVVVGEKEAYLRGRDRAAMTALFRQGAGTVGVTDVPAHPTELDGLRAVVAESAPGDVCALMCHAEREEVFAWLRQRGARLLGPAELRARVGSERVSLRVEPFRRRSNEP